MIEMVFDGRFPPAGDEEDLLDAVIHEFFRHVLHDGLARDGKHFLRLALGGREQPRTEAGNGNDGILNHFLRISASVQIAVARRVIFYPLRHFPAITRTTMDA